MSFLNCEQNQEQFSKLPFNKQNIYLSQFESDVFVKNQGQIITLKSV